ncbi:hypothetical protein ACVWXN_008101 [Bradyrhizobium sp. i1.4.4]
MLARQRRLAFAGDGIALRDLATAGMAGDDDLLQIREDAPVREFYEDRIERIEGRHRIRRQRGVAALPSLQRPAQRIRGQPVRVDIDLRQKLRDDHERALAVVARGNLRSMGRHVIFVGIAQASVQHDDGARDRRQRQRPVAGEIERQHSLAADRKPRVGDRPHRLAVGRFFVRRERIAGNERQCDCGEAGQRSHDGYSPSNSNQ